MLSNTDEALIADLIGYLRSRSRPDPTTSTRRFSAFFAKAFDTAVALGTTVGEAGLWRGTAIRTADQDEFSRYWKSIANSLAAHVRLVRDGVDALHEVGQLPPPASVRRLAIILRRCKRPDLEAQLLRAWLEATPRGNSVAYEELISRLFRAEALSDRQR